MFNMESGAVLEIGNYMLASYPVYFEVLNANLISIGYICSMLAIIGFCKFVLRMFFKMASFSSQE